MYIKTTALGRITEPKVRQSQAGKTVLSFGLAAQMGKENTEWINCSVVGAFADTMAKHLKKGDLVFVEARPSTNKGQNGVSYTTHFVDFLRICGGNQPQEQEGYNQGSAPNMPF